MNAFFPLSVWKILGEITGLSLRNPHDCVVLSQLIEEKTHQHLGVNTLRRLLGFAEDVHLPRTTTLDILAQYLDYPTWEQLMVDYSSSNSAFLADKNGISVEALSPQSRIQLEYAPDRCIVLEYQGEFRFLVLENENSKLQPGDTLTISHLMLHYPLMAGNVIRKGTNLGPFTGGKSSGLTAITLLS